MREIEFRAWNEKTKTMSPAFNLRDVANRWAVIEDREIMQFTGLRDSTGAKIFEGDIVSVSNDDYHETTVHKVVYGSKIDNYPAFYLKGFDSESNSFSEIFDSGNYCCAVIGNLHQHPHLLEQKK